jgi:hypothetical protein
MTKKAIKTASDKLLKEREWELDNGAAEDFEGEYIEVCRQADDRYFATQKEESWW